MKKILRVVLILVVCSINNVYALNYKEASKESNIKQEINPIYEGKDFQGVNVIYTIPEDFKEDEIILTPKIFGAIAENTYVMPGDKLKINISIKNLSNIEYKYKDNSFILSTDDITRYGVKDNFKEINIKGFDNRVLNDYYATYRVANKAILNLYNVTSSSKIKKEDLLDENLGMKLKDRGYSGIGELNKFYIDYYNQKYNLNKNDLNDFDYNIIKDIFNGKMFFVKESNKELIALSYNYFYNKLLSFTFKDEEVTDSNSEEKSIGSYMKNSLGNNYFKEAFKNILPNNEYSINDMKLNINGAYTVNVFMYYNFFGYMELRLENVNKKENIDSEETFLEEGLIIPPNTGII